MLKSRRTRTELEIFINNRYDDTSHLIFKEFCNRQQQSGPEFAWKEDVDHSRNDIPGGSGLESKISSQDKEPGVIELNRTASPSPHEVVNDNKLKFTESTENNTQSTICSIL